MVEITDVDSAEAWLKVHSPEVCVAIATRVALRSLPAIAFVDAAALGELLLPVFRALLTSGLAGTWPSPEARQAATEAANAAANAAAEAKAVAAKAPSANYAAVNASYAAANSSYAAAYTASAYSATASASSYAATAIAAATATAARAYAQLSWDSGRFDAGDSVDQLFNQKLWAKETEPPTLAEARAKLLAILDAEPQIWGFWARWYRGMCDGRPMGWEVQRRVALIPEMVWRDGPAAVAAEIARIEADLAAEPLDQDALRAHLQKLAAAPELHADAADSVADLIGAAIERYCRDVPANALPDGFEPFADLPKVFRAIAAKLRDSSDAADKLRDLQALVNELHATIAQLRSELSDARLRLSEVRLTALEAGNTRRSGASLLTNVASIATIGGFGLAALAFLGVEAKDLNYESFKTSAVGLAADMAAVEHSSLPEQRPSAPAHAPRPPHRPQD